MVKPQYDLSRLDPELLRFLTYTRNFTSCSNAIPLSLLQNGFVTFYDIFMDEDQIPIALVDYEDTDGTVRKVRPAHCIKFALSVLYAQYRFAQTDDPNANIPANWTANEFLSWEHQVQTGRLSKVQVRNIIGTVSSANAPVLATTSMTDAQLLTSFDRAK